MKKINLLLSVLVAMSMLLAACATPTPVPPTKPPEPTKAPAAPPAAPPTTAPAAPTAVPPTAAPAALDPAKLVDTKCSQCHNTDRIKAAKKTAAEWTATVERMVGKDWAGKASPKPTADEQAAIIKYLAATYAAAAPTVPPTKAPTPVVDRKSTVVIGMSEKIEFLNVLYTQGGNSLSASKLAQRGLLFVDDKSNWIGELAKEVPTVQNGGVSADGKTITYKLRDGVKWHDGTPVTSADVKATWEMIMDSKNAVITRFGYNQIEKIDTPDPLTVVITFKSVFMSWPILFDALASKAVIEANKANLDKSEAMRVPMGFGPYKLVKYIEGDYVQYIANDNYFRGKPKIQNIIIKFYPSVDAEMQALEVKEIDIAWAVPVANVPQLQKMESKGIKMVTAASTGSDRYAMNPAEPLFQDVNVRRAIAHAIDRETMIKQQLFGLGKIVNSEWGNSPWENKNLPAYNFDLNKCKSLMDAAGWKPGADGIRVKDGKRFSFVHLTWTGNLQRENTQMIAQQMLKACGIEFKPERKPSSELFGSWTQNGVWSQGKYQMGGWSHSLRVPDPEVSARFLCKEIASETNQAGSQWYRYCNPEVDKLLVAQASELDPAKRNQLLFKAQELIHADAYQIYLFAGDIIYGVNADLKNFKLHSFFNFYYNPQEWSW